MDLLFRRSRDLERVPLLPGSLWPRVVVPLSVPSMGQRELFKKVFLSDKTVGTPPKKRSNKKTKQKQNKK